MNRLSADDGFPTRLVCASLARLFMFILGLLGVLFRTAVPTGLPVSANAGMERTEEERLQRIAVRLKPGDSLESLLGRHGLQPKSAQQLIQKLRAFLNARSFPVGQKIDLVIDPKEVRVRAIEVFLGQRVVRADATAEGWRVADQWASPFIARFEVFRGTVTDSFAQSLARVGLTSEQVKQLRKIFASDVDLLRDTGPGDAFTIVVTERLFANGHRSVGPIAAASLEIAGESYNAFQHGEVNGKPQYFDAEGARLPRRFMAAPLKYDRISSTYNLARPDPITGRLRPHEAIDYVASAGTPVMAVGQGVVEFAGWHGGYGYLVEINHGDGYLSSYAHLSSFGENLAIGKSVKAGSVIGHVGDTGYSTGPHLHFEFSRYHNKLDYLSDRIDAGETLAGQELRRFDIARDKTLTVMRGKNFQISQVHKRLSH